MSRAVCDTVMWFNPMQPAIDKPLQSLDRIAYLIAPVACVALIAVFSSFTGDGQGSALSEALWILVSNGATTLAWVLAAIGYGLPLRMWLANRARDAMALQIALGIALLLALDAALGALGVLQSPWTAWGLIVVGLVLAAAQLARWLRSPHHLSPPDWLMWSWLPGT
jgi:hypothetical protein